MGRRFDENIGIVDFDNLIAGMYPPPEVFHVELAAGQGLLERGTLLALNNGIQEKITIATTGKANAVLAEAVYTGEPEAGNSSGDSEEEQAGTTDTAATVMGIAYRTGHFNTNRLIVAEGYEVTAADKEALRMVGVLLSDAVEF